MPEYAVEVSGLRKSYGALEAVRGIDLRVARGEVFALLGPNGAGKTTAVEILEGHRRRDGGSVDVLGFDPGRLERGFKERIGVVLQATGVEPYLTVEETLALYSGYYPKPRPVEALLELVGLQEQRRTRVNQAFGRPAAPPRRRRRPRRRPGAPLPGTNRPQASTRRRGAALGR